MMCPLLRFTMLGANTRVKMATAVMFVSTICLACCKHARQHIGSMQQHMSEQDRQEVTVLSEALSCVVGIKYAQHP